MSRKLNSLSPQLSALLLGGSLGVCTIACDSEGRGPQSWSPDSEADSDGSQDSDGSDDDDLPNAEPIQNGTAGGLRQTVRISTDTGRICTGVLLNAYTVLTAAHCVGPVSSLEWGVVSTADDSATIDRARVWSYDAHYHHNGDGPGEMYDVAVVGLNSAIELSVDTAPHYASIGTVRPEDGTTLWINGRMDNGVDSSGIMRRATTIEALSAADPRYPFQLLDNVDSPINPGDSGGPLFRERAGETNDGRGGFVAPVIYGLVARGASYTRLDPIKSWIDTRAAEILRAADWYEGDYSWTRCNRDSCPVYRSSDVDGAWLHLGNVPRDTKMGVFVQSGGTMVVSYPMEDRDRQVQIVRKSDGFVNAGSADHGPPPTADLRIEDRYCATASCTVYSKRNLQDSDVTPIGAVGCGTRMGVFVKSQNWVVVSYPMDDRGRAVQVVPRAGSTWSTTPPACM